MTKEAIRVEAEGEARPAPHQPEDAARTAERYRQAVLRALAAALRSASPRDNAEATEDVAGRGPHPVVQLARVAMPGALSIRAGTALSADRRRASDPVDLVFFGPGAGADNVARHLMTGLPGYAWRPTVLGSDMYAYIDGWWHLPQADLALGPALAGMRLHLRIYRWRDAVSSR